MCMWGWDWEEIKRRWQSRNGDTHCHTYWEKKTWTKKNSKNMWEIKNLKNLKKKMWDWEKLGENVKKPGPPYNSLSAFHMNTCRMENSSNSNIFLICTSLAIYTSLGWLHFIHPYIHWHEYRYVHSIRYIKSHHNLLLIHWLDYTYTPCR